MDELPDDPAGGRDAFVLEWWTDVVPPGVTTGWEAGAPEDAVDLDDPEREPVPVADEAWEEARRVLFEDAAVAQARQQVGERFGTSYDRVTVWLVLRDGIEEPDVAVWAPDDQDPGDDDAVVLLGVTDASDLRDLDPTERTDVYLELVTGLLQVALEEG